MGLMFPLDESHRGVGSEQGKNGGGNCGRSFSFRGLCVL
jgi:hypothetical protein